MPGKIIITKDGSPSIEWEEGVTYHSTFGALQESQHIFINEGWKALAGTAPVNVFELGLGTGLNALLTLIEAERSGRQVIYEAVEAYPLESDEVRKLDYCTLLGRPDLKSCFERLHQCADKWRQWGRRSCTVRFLQALSACPGTSTSVPSVMPPNAS